MEITENDKSVMRLIIKLTEGANGKPPTLAEIALAVGLQSSSRANIQRQLVRLRPDFVDWTSSSRSIHVTDAGKAVLGIVADQYAPFISGLAASSLIPSLLASGLTKLVSNRLENNLPIQAPYPKEWQRGLNLLSAEGLQRNINLLNQPSDIFELCKKPLSSWQIKFSGYERGYVEALLDEEERPTNFCLELAQEIKNGNAELELCQKKMLVVRNKAEQHRRQDSYVAFRRFLIENPVVTETTLVATALQPSFDPFSSELYDMYEPVPSYLVENEMMLLCGYCGWTLMRHTTTGRLQCGDDRCRVLTANFTRNTQYQKVEKIQDYRRVNKAIRRYIVAPGKYEIDAFKQFESRGLNVSLWPAYDSYDLKITFNNGEVWAMDIKDWQNPFLLAKKLTELSPKDYDKAFYVVPDERVQEDKSYLATLRGATVGKSFEVVTISSLSDRVLHYT